MDLWVRVVVAGAFQLPLGVGQSECSQFHFVITPCALGFEPEDHSETERIPSHARSIAKAVRAVRMKSLVEEK